MLRGHRRARRARPSSHRRGSPRDNLAIEASPRASPQWLPRSRRTRQPGCSRRYRVDPSPQRNIRATGADDDPSPRAVRGPTGRCPCQRTPHPPRGPPRTRRARGGRRDTSARRQRSRSAGSPRATRWTRSAGALSRRPACCHSSAQHARGGVPSAHTVHGGAGGRGRGAEPHVGEWGAVRVERNPRSGK